MSGIPNPQLYVGHNVIDKAGHVHAVHGYRQANIDAPAHYVTTTNTSTRRLDLSRVDWAETRRMEVMQQQADRMREREED